MSTYAVNLEGALEEAILRRAEASGEPPEVAVVRVLEDAVIAPRTLAGDEEDVEPEWVSRMDEESRARHRELRAFNRSLNLGNKRLTDAAFDRGWIYEGED